MLKLYGVKGLIKIIISYINTKIFYRNSRLIRFPFDIRNKSNIDLGIGLTTGVGCRIEAFPICDEIVLKFGENVQINDDFFEDLNEDTAIKIFEGIKSDQLPKFGSQKGRIGFEPNKRLTLVKN